MMTVILAGICDTQLAANIMHFMYNSTESLQYLHRLRQRQPAAAAAATPAAARGP